ALARLEELNQRLQRFRKEARVLALLENCDRLAEEHLGFVVTTLRCSHQRERLSGCRLRTDVLRTGCLHRLTGVGLSRTDLPLLEQDLRQASLNLAKRAAVL